MTLALIEVELFFQVQFVKTNFIEQQELGAELRVELRADLGQSKKATLMTNICTR